MVEKHEYKPSPTEVAKAERQLTPEQAVGSKAGYEILKHEAELVEVGIDGEQIKQAAELARDRAVEEYHQLEKSEPWHRTMDIVEGVKQRLSPDEQTLIDGHLQWAKEFVYQWKDALEKARKLYGGASTYELVLKLSQYSLMPTGTSFHYARDPRLAVVGFNLIGPKVRALVDPSAKREEDRSYETLKPTKEGMAAIFKAFGADIPEFKGKEWGWDSEMYDTQFSGVSLSPYERRDGVTVYFNLETLEKMIEVDKELNKTEVEQ